MSLSPLIRCGTSTWAYEGWQGLVYHKPYPKGRFKKDCLAEYAQYQYQGAPLFRTVGLDATFYRPPSVGQLAQNARHLPPGFELCSKVWEGLTIPQYPAVERYGEKAGQANPRFLDAMIRKAVAQERRAYVLVNNRAEGCAPLTVQALVDSLLTQ